MKAESNIQPNKFEIENIENGMCDIVFCTNVEQIPTEEEESERYTYDMYRLKTYYRDNLREKLEDEESYNIWLDFARQTEEQANAKTEIEKLQEELNDTDYKIIKCSEYQLAGIPIPYDIAELHLQRQKLRDKINELQNV